MSATAGVANREAVGSSGPWSMYPRSLLWGQGTSVRASQWIGYKAERAEISSSQGVLQPRSPASCAEGSSVKGLFSCCGWCTALWLRDRDVSVARSPTVLFPPRGGEGVGLTHILNMQANRRNVTRSCFSTVSLERFLLAPVMSQSMFLLSNTSADLGMGSFYSWADLKMWLPFTHEFPEERKRTELLFQAALPREGVASPSQICACLLLLAPYNNSLQESRKMMWSV